MMTKVLCPAQSYSPTGGPQARGLQRHARRNEAGDRV